WLPDDDHAMVLPWASVIVIIVLLKVAFTCAVPELMFLRSRRRNRGAAAAVLAIYLFPPLEFQVANSTSSYRRSGEPAPFASAHSYACAALGPEAPSGGAARGSSRDPSAA